MCGLYLFAPLEGVAQKFTVFRKSLSCTIFGWFFVLSRVDKKDALFNNIKITCFRAFDILIFLAFCYLQQASSESICYIFPCKNRDLYIQSLQLDCVQLSLYNR